MRVCFQLDYLCLRVRQCTPNCHYVSASVCSLCSFLLTWGTYLTNCVCLRCSTLVSTWGAYLTVHLWCKPVNHKHTHSHIHLHKYPQTCTDTFRCQTHINTKIYTLSLKNEGIQTSSLKNSQCACKTTLSEKKVWNCHWGGSLPFQKTLICTL